MKTISCLCVGLAAGLMGGCVSAEAELPEIEVTQPNIQFQAYPAAGYEGTVTVSFPINAAKLGSSTKEVNQKAIVALHMRDVLLVPRAGVDSLHFVHHLRVIARVATDPGPGTLVVDYDRPAGESGADLHATPAEPVDLLPLWRPKSNDDRTIQLTLTVTGQVPATDWAIDGHFVLSAELHN